MLLEKSCSRVKEQKYSLRQIEIWHCEENLEEKLFQLCDVTLNKLVEVIEKNQEHIAERQENVL